MQSNNVTGYWEKDVSDAGTSFYFYKGYEWKAMCTQEDLDEFEIEESTALVRMVEFPVNSNYRVPNQTVLEKLFPGKMKDFLSHRQDFPRRYHIIKTGITTLKIIK